MGFTVVAEVLVVPYREEKGEDGIIYLVPNLPSDVAAWRLESIDRTNKVMTVRVLKKWVAEG